MANLIVVLTDKFTLGIYRFGKKLKGMKEFEIGSQIIRCGTAIGANVAEAQNCESNKDFIHKMKVAAKETSECRYWLKACRDSDTLPDPDDLFSQVISIEKVLSKIIATSKRKEE